MIIAIAALLFSVSGCNENRVKTGNQTSGPDSNLNQIGERFIASLAKNPKASYQYLHKDLTTRLSLQDFQRLNQKLFATYGRPVSFNRAVQPMRGVRLLPDGATQEELTLWYPVKTTQDDSGTTRLKLSFAKQGFNPKITRYVFLRSRTSN